jgi:hypothetical protein
VKPPIGVPIMAARDNGRTPPVKIHDFGTEWKRITPFIKAGGIERYAITGKAPFVTMNIGMSTTTDTDKPGNSEGVLTAIAYNAKGEVIGRFDNKRLSVNNQPSLVFPLPAGERVEFTVANVAPTGGSLFQMNHRPTEPRAPVVRPKPQR